MLVLQQLFGAFCVIFPSLVYAKFVASNLRNALSVLGKICICACIVNFGSPLAAIVSDYSGLFEQKCTTITVTRFFYSLILQGPLCSICRRAAQSRKALSPSNWFRARFLAISKQSRSTEEIKKGIWVIRFHVVPK